MGPEEGGSYGGDNCVSGADLVSDVERNRVLLRVRMDVTSKEEIQQIVDELSDGEGKLHILVNK